MWTRRIRHVQTGNDFISPYTAHVAKQVFRYQTLTALMLSSQTKDETTAAAVAKLKAHQPGGLTLESVLEMSDEILDAHICKVGFHKRKTTLSADAYCVATEPFE
jgi:endonuclease III